jgi:DNA-binding MurR/RpiR family transcriptional regulator
MFEERIKKHYKFLPKNQKRLAERFLSFGHEAAFLTLAKLASQLKTSEATLIRFARSLGYGGYPHLQRELQNSIRQKLSPPKALQESLAEKDDRDIFSEIFETEHHNLNKARESNSKPIIEQAIQEIIKARRVGVTGYRSSSSMAHLLYILLSEVRKNCELLEFHMGSLPSQIINYGAKDLLICISLPRYSYQTVVNLKYVKKKKCKTIAITDSPLSPIGQEADLVLLAGNRSLTYFNFLASTVALINCLVAGVSLRAKNSLANLEEVNHIVTEWGFLLR